MKRKDSDSDSNATATAAPSRPVSPDEIYANQ